MLMLCLFAAACCGEVCCKLLRIDLVSLSLGSRLRLRLQRVTLLWGSFWLAPLTWGGRSRQTGLDALGKGCAWQTERKREGRRENRNPGRARTRGRKQKNERGWEVERLSPLDYGRGSARKARRLFSLGWLKGKVGQAASGRLLLVDRDSRNM